MTIASTQLTIGQSGLRSVLNRTNRESFRMLEVFPTTVAPVALGSGPQTDIIIWSYKLTSGIISRVGEAVNFDFFMTNTVVAGGGYTAKLMWAAVNAGDSAPAFGAYTDFITLAPVADEADQLNMWGSAIYYTDSGTPKMQAIGSGFAFDGHGNMVVTSQAAGQTDIGEHTLTRNPTAVTVSAQVAQDVYFQLAFTYPASFDVTLQRYHVQFQPKIVS